MDWMNRPIIVSAIAMAIFLVTLLSNAADLSPTFETRESLANLIFASAMLALGLFGLDIFRDAFSEGALCFDKIFCVICLFGLAIMIPATVYFLSVWVDAFKVAPLPSA